MVAFVEFDAAFSGSDGMRGGTIFGRYQILWFWASLSCTPQRGSGKPMVTRNADAKRHCCCAYQEVLTGLCTTEVERKPKTTPGFRLFRALPRLPAASATPLRWYPTGRGRDRSRH